MFGFVLVGGGGGGCLQAVQLNYVSGEQKNPIRLSPTPSDKHTGSGWPGFTVCCSWPHSRWLSSPVRVLKLDLILGKSCVRERKDALKGLDDPSMRLLSSVECVFSHSAAHVFFSHLLKIGEAEDSICNNIDFLPFTAGLQVADELSGGKRKKKST